MSNTRDYESAVIVSVTEIFSVNCRDYMSALIVSVTAPPLYKYGAQQIMAKSPYNIYIDMNANSKR